MSSAVLMYHDVTRPGSADDASGFPGGDAARYKLTLDCFEAHLSAIAARGQTPVLTFDDGGVSAIECIADLVEAHGWRGSFFVTTGYLGHPGFLDARQVRELRARGHVIGSHSHSHPLRMGGCSEAKLRDEWTRSVAILADALGEPVTAASVPGGHHTEIVLRTAAAAGIRTLFTSQPTVRDHHVDGMRVVGRYAIQRSTRAATAAALAAGDLLPRAQWAASWAVKSAIKSVAGPWYVRVRAKLLGASPSVRWGDDAT